MDNANVQTEIEIMSLGENGKNELMGTEGKSLTLTQEESDLLLSHVRETLERPRALCQGS